MIGFDLDLVVRIWDYGLTGFGSWGMGWNCYWIWVWTNGSRDQKVNGLMSSG